MAKKRAFVILLLEIKLLKANHKQTAIFPLAVPSIASPGAMLAAVLLTENSVFSFTEQIQTALVMLSVLILAYVVMLLAGLGDYFKL